jgi:uncharacterized membrane protein YdfJ with MMPL/SSD domain
VGGLTAAFVDHAELTAGRLPVVCVFLAFLVADEVFLKLLGIGMATAIVVDATIVRLVLVPTLMQLFGRAKRGSRSHRRSRLQLVQAGHAGSTVA